MLRRTKRQKKLLRDKILKRVRDFILGRKGYKETATVSNRTILKKSALSIFTHISKKTYKNYRKNRKLRQSDSNIKQIKNGVPTYIESIYG